MEREKKYNYVRNTFSWDGKRYDVKGKTIEEVYKKIAKMKVSLERGEIVINANTTVDHWFKEWVETYKNAAGLTPKSLKMYDEKYRNYIQPVIGAMKLRDVREIHLQKILNDHAFNCQCRMYAFAIPWFSQHNLCTNKTSAALCASSSFRMLTGRISWYRIARLSSICPASICASANCSIFLRYLWYTSGCFSFAAMIFTYKTAI